MSERDEYRDLVMASEEEDIVKLAEQALSSFPTISPMARQSATARAEQWSRALLRTSEAMGCSTVVAFRATALKLPVDEREAELPLLAIGAFFLIQTARVEVPDA